MPRGLRGGTHLVDLEREGGRLRKTRKHVPGPVEQGPLADPRPDLKIRTPRVLLLAGIDAHQPSAIGKLANERARRHFEGPIHQDDVERAICRSPLVEIALTKFTLRPTSLRRRERAPVELDGGSTSPRARRALRRRNPRRRRPRAHGRRASARRPATDGRACGGRGAFASGAGRGQILIEIGKLHECRGDEIFARNGKERAEQRCVGDLGAELAVDHPQSALGRLGPMPLVTRSSP